MLESLRLMDDFVAGLNDRHPHAETVARTDPYGSWLYSH